MTKSQLLFALALTTLGLGSLQAQEQPLKERPDAFPPKQEQLDSKAVTMAETLDEMADWDRYPTYGTYLAMMEQWATQFPQRCRIDTIGTSIRGRLILCAVLHGEAGDNEPRPEFFYSSTMHGDEVTGYVMMLRLIDTLLRVYGSNTQYTNLMNSVDIYINPLSNPDGTYNAGDNTVRGAVRYNANWVDLNRNFPDPFGSAPLNEQQPENTAMIDYVSQHHFRLSANLHGGSEVMNYPWDSFTSLENPHPERDWWIAVCKRFIDTSRTYSSSHFRDVTTQGYIEGGDWYVIPNGRQDYLNYYHNCREMTMELSTAKTLSSDQLPEYWRFLQHSLVNYIEEINTFEYVGIHEAAASGNLTVYPNPTRSYLFISEPTKETVRLFDMQGRCVMTLPAGTQQIDLQPLSAGVYLLRTGIRTAKIIKH